MYWCLRLVAWLTFYFIFFLFLLVFESRVLYGCLYACYLLLEKRKLARRIQQCFAKLSSASDDERPRLEDNLAELQKDYNYVEVCTCC